MKNLIILVLLLTVSVSFAQNNKKGHRSFGKKFNELEKIKLLEELNLDEETAVRFFSRRNIFKNKMDLIRKNKEELFGNVENILKDNGSDIDHTKLLNEILEHEQQMLDLRREFVMSLQDILTNDQILKYVIFERKFKKDVRDLLLERGRRKFSRNKNSDN